MFTRTNSKTRNGSDNYGNSRSRNSSSRFFSQKKNVRKNRSSDVEQINSSRYVNKIDSNIPNSKISEATQTRKLSELQLDKHFLHNLTNFGYTSLTPIQEQSFESVLNRQDLLGLAGTGTGKTGAFLIPIIQNILSNISKKVLILAPTRELAGQINDVFYQLTRELRIFSVLCIGGNDMYRQINGIRRGFNLIIGTPGRIIDLEERKILNLETFDTVVLDEVDTMLDMGFTEDVKYIVSKLRKQRQSLFFSATINSKAEEILSSFLSENYKKIAVANTVSKDQIHQDIINYTNFENKKENLIKVLQDHKDQKIIIFANTKREVDQLEAFLANANYEISAIHGDKRQSQRKRMLDAFKHGDTEILLATNVASRGIDIKGVDLVINYDEPESYDDYIHRIGRTGRAESMGKALTFVRNRETNYSSSRDSRSYGGNRNRRGGFGRR